MAGAVAAFLLTERVSSRPSCLDCSCCLLGAPRRVARLR